MFQNQINLFFYFFCHESQSKLYPEVMIDFSHNIHFVGIFLPASFCKKKFIQESTKLVLQVKESEHANPLLYCIPLPQKLEQGNPSEKQSHT